ncbi:MAG: hypothetical protein FJ303_01990 [Planctomycetes bacterium]|nr:hypothetical protein [Planctomycetota bacterium]
MPQIIRIATIILLTLTAGCRRDAGKSQNDSKPADTITSKTGGELVLVPGGSFTMGDAAGREDETPHPVTVSAFYMDKHAVTQELYTKVMGTNPSKHVNVKCPVERVQWIDAVRFCNKCSELDGLTPCYNTDTWDCNFAADGYRLPTEAEWEFACRARGTGRFCFGDDEKELPKYAWLYPDSKGKTHPVGEKLANRFGLYDMHGNVWQWCHDRYSDSYYKQSPKDDPRGPTTGDKRVLRGGAWDTKAEKCRSAYRHKDFAVLADLCFGTDPYGFRRVRAMDATPRGAMAALRGATLRVAFHDAKRRATLSLNQLSFVSTGAEDEKKTLPKGKPDAAKLKGTIIFVSDRSGSLKIWSMDASGKNAKQLTKSEGPDADPRFSPDGKLILYTTVVGGFPEVWVMNRDGSQPKKITTGREASWAPNGKSIVFINDNQTFVRDLDTGKERLVTPKDWERCGVPAFSPDGKTIAVASRHLPKIGIFLVDLTGKPLGQLKTEEACCTPAWSKDGKRILCQSDKGHIHEVRVDGKSDEQITTRPDVQHDARYSPDGTMFLFCRAPTPKGPWQICVQRIDGDEDDFVVLTKEGSNQSPDWHAHE